MELFAGLQELINAGAGSPVLLGAITAFVVCRLRPHASIRGKVRGFQVCCGFGKAE